MKSKRIYLVFALLFTALSAAFVFQNCAPNKFSSANFGQSISNSIGASHLSSRADGTVYAQDDTLIAVRPEVTFVGGSGSSGSGGSAATPNPTPTPLPQASFGGGSAPSGNSNVGSYTPSEPKAPLPSNPYVGTTGSNQGLSYNDAIKLRKAILDSGRFPFIYNDASGGFTVISISASDSLYWQPIQAIKAIQHDGDWSKIVGYKVNDVSAALGYMPNDIYNACINSGLVVNSKTNGLIVGTAASLGCKTGTFNERGSTVKWACNCAGDFSGWNGMGAANCYQKLQ